MSIWLDTRVTLLVRETTFQRISLIINFQSFNDPLLGGHEFVDNWSSSQSVPRAQREHDGINNPRIKPLVVP